MGRCWCGAKYPRMQRNRGSASPAKYLGVRPIQRKNQFRWQMQKTIENRRESPEKAGGPALRGLDFHWQTR